MEVSNLCVALLPESSASSFTQDDHWHGRSIVHDVTFDEAVERMRVFYEPF